MADFKFEENLLKNFTGLLFLIFPIIGWTQEFKPDNYVVTQYSLNEGLPQSSVNDIIQTKDGYIWLATFGGLVRFDGQSFTVFNKSNTKKLHSERILELYEDKKGRIWIFPEGDEGIIQWFKGGETETFTFAGTGETRIELNEDNRGVLWASAYKKTFRLKGNSFVEIDEINNKDAANKAIKGKDGVWFAYDFRIIKTLGDSVIIIQEGTGNPSEEYIEVQEFPKNSGNLFIGTINAGMIYQYDSNREVFNTKNGLYDDQFIRFEKFDDESLIINLPGIISIWDGIGFNAINPVLDQPDISYRSILEDNEGNYWFGTDGDGLFKFRPSPITMIDKDQGLENEKMLSMTLLNNGKALFSTNCGEIFEWDGVSAQRSTIHSFMESECNWTVFQDSKDRIWIGSLGVVYGTSLVEPVKTFENELALGGINVFGIMEDSNGSIWILSANGLYEYNGNTFNNYSTKDGLYSNDVRTLVEDKKGVLWIGTKSGLNRLSNGNVKKVKLNEVSNSSQTNQPAVRAIYEDSEGYVWIGTYGNGLFRIKGRQVLNITKDDGLFDDIISHIIEDDNGNFWMGSNRGISRVKRDELDDYLDGKIESFTISSFGSNDGMNSAETNGGFQPSTFTDNEGKIYFPTVSGVAIVDPNKIISNSVPPPVYIELLRTEDSVIEKNETVILSYDTAFLEINYTGINFTDSKGLKFKYKMIGLDDDWIEVGNIRSALYSKIPPGEYTFQVSARNSDGIWNEKGASVMVSVIPPFWQTIWFLSILVVCLLAIGPAIYYYRIRHLKTENNRQKKFTEQLIESQENERRRIASELHDGLGQQILVIKNRLELTKLNIIDDPQTIDQLNEIQHNADRSIEDVRNISHNLRPVLLEKFGLTDAVLNLCDQLEKSTSLAWSYHVDDIDDVFPKNKEINFYRILQEGANNILKHAESKQPSIRVNRTKSHVNLIIYDDGKGYEASMVSKTGMGLGLIGIKERVETLSGQIKVVSKKGEGTTIKIQIPIEEYD